jgi:hypothetical protein
LFNVTRKVEPAQDFVEYQLMTFLNYVGAQGNKVNAKPETISTLVVVPGTTKLANALKPTHSQ